MAIRTELTYLIDDIGRMLNDKNFEVLDPELDIQRVLEDNEFFYSGLPFYYDGPEKAFTADSSVVKAVGFWATDIVFNDSQDQSGSVITPDTFNYRRSRFTFTAAQSSTPYIYLFGSGFKPKTAAADLLDTHPDLEQHLLFTQIRRGSFSGTISRGKPNLSISETWRLQEFDLHRKYATNLRESTYDLYRERYPR